MSKSRRTFDITISTKSVLFKFMFWGGCRGAAPSPFGCTMLNAPYITNYSYNSLLQFKNTFPFALTTPQDETIPLAKAVNTYAKFTTCRPYYDLCFERLDNVRMD
jgi:hypothetical protein